MRLRIYNVGSQCYQTIYIVYLNSIAQVTSNDICENIELVAPNIRGKTAIKHVFC